MALGNISFTLLSFFYCILICVVYFCKPRIKNEETKLYSYLIITCMTGVTLSLGTYFFMANLDKYPILNYIFSKAYLLFIIVYLAIMTLYVFKISIFEKDEKLIKHKTLIINSTIILFTLAASLILILPISYVSQNKIVYSYGQSVSLTFTITRVVAIMWIIILIFKRKNVPWKKVIPMIAYIIVGSIVSIIQKNNPELLLSTAMIVFVTFLMYFTIENPDVKMIESLNEAKDQAERANNAKTDFLSSMSHEIRTPLNAIVGFSNGLIEEEGLKERAREDVSSIITASASLLELVNGILDISKIEAGKLEIIDTNYNFHKVFDELVLLTKARLGEKALDFRYSYDESIPEYLYGDASRVKQVILNLLTNSVKYTNTGFIEFKVRSVIKNDIVRLIISVEDSGIGIKKENIDKLFSKFERLGVEKDTTVEGTGLGLAITKRLVEMMGGKIVVQSVYGKGSIFTISLDQKIVTGSELEKLKKQEAVKIEDVKVLDASNKKVLVVDDNNLNLKVAKRLLEQYKCETICVSSGFECIDKIACGEKYDLILLDDMMPKLSGSETLVKLKEMPSFNMPVVALTANAISGMKEEYLKKGFNDYLSKPIEKAELNRVMNKFLS